MEKQEITREYLGLALNSIKSDYNENKQTIARIEKSISDKEKLLEFYGEKKSKCINELKYIKNKDTMSYIQFVLFGLSIIAGVIASMIYLPLIACGITFFDACSMVRRDKLRKLTIKELNRVNKLYDTADANKKNYERYLDYYKREDKIYSKKIDLLSDMLFNGDKKQSFDCNEVALKLNQIDDENINGNTL